MYKLFIIITIMIIQGCASRHGYMRGTVVMKMSDTTAHICMGDNDVKIGTPINFYNYHCQISSASDYAPGYVCSSEILGVGHVTKLLNTHYSEVTIDGNFKFNEGTLVEREK